MNERSIDHELRTAPKTHLTSYSEKIIGLHSITQNHKGFLDSSTHTFCDKPQVFWHVGADSHLALLFMQVHIERRTVQDDMVSKVVNSFHRKTYVIPILADRARDANRALWYAITSAYSDN